MKKKIKGEWGYIDYQRKRVMLITLVLYVCAIGMYLLGYLTLHTNKSIWSVLAILAVLPASKSMVNLIMFLRFRSLDKEDYLKYADAVRDAPAIYEAPFTTYEKTFYIESLACINNTVSVCYLGKPSKKNDHNSDMKMLNDHLINVLKNDGFKDCTVKIFDSQKGYCERLNGMNENMETKDRSRDLAVINTLRSVVL